MSHRSSGKQLFTVIRSASLSNLYLSLRWSYMLYQLIAYYTIDRGVEKTLWEYLACTVIIFQNAAVLEVNPSRSLPPRS